VLHYPYDNPLFLDLRLNDTDDRYYAERSTHLTLDQIDCPDYLSGTWGGIHTIPTHTAFERIDEATRLVMATPARKLERPYHEHEEEMIRWFDALTKGRETDTVDEPPVKRYVTGRNQWRHEDTLIPERVRWDNHYLRNFGRLLSNPEPLSDVQPSSFVQEPPILSTSLANATFTSTPSPTDAEITGPMALTVYASIDATDTTWMGRIQDIDQGGTKTMLSRGYLRGPHRRVDGERSKPYWPYHPHREAEPIKPGKVYEYRIRFQPIAHVFGKRHRIELELRSMMLPDELSDLPSELRLLPHSQTICHRIHHTHEYQSQLVFPFIAPPEDDQWIDEGTSAHPGPAL
jgi:predicted acyl esterase